MAKRDSKTATNASAIKAILGRTKTVEVDGFHLELFTPTLADGLKVRELLSQTIGDDGKAEGDLDEMMSIMAEVSVEAIRVTAKTSRQDAEALFFRTGGEMGELADEARKQCGLDVELLQSLSGEGAEAEAIDDPS